MLWLSLLLPVSLPHLGDFPTAYLQLIKGALYRSSPTHANPFLTPQLGLSEASWREISLSANSSSPVQFGLKLHSPEGEEADGL